MCQKESWGAIFGTTEAHSTQRDQPPRMHGPGLWMYEQKKQRVTPVRMIGVNCILWCPGWDDKDLSPLSLSLPLSVCLSLAIFLLLPSSSCLSFSLSHY